MFELLFKTRNFPRLRLSQSGTNNFALAELRKNALIISQSYLSNFALYRSFSSDVTAAILVYQNNEMAAILVYGTGISSFLFKYFVLFHHPTGATDHVNENDLYDDFNEIII